MCTLINNIKTLKSDTDKKGLLVDFFMVGRDILLIYFNWEGGSAGKEKNNIHCGSFVPLGRYSLNMDGNNLHLAHNPPPLLVVRLPHL